MPSSLSLLSPSQLSPTEWRAVVGNYGIPKDYHLLPIKLLSDGLKTRLVFCEISLQTPHLLLFDEPTNAADMEVI
jgi:ATP-binding cassette, subfamily F, member 2